MSSEFVFGPDKRLKKRADFLAVQGLGRRIRSSHFILAYRRRERDTTVSLSSRFGVTITTKISKSACRRNKLKRRLRDIFRLNWSKLRSGFDFVVIALTGSTDIDYQEIKDEILSSLKRAKLLIN